MPVNPQNIFPSQFDIPPYNALLLERILFEFRRGLPVFIDHKNGFFMKPTEFLDQENLPVSLITITGDQNGDAIVSDETWQPYAQNLLKIIKLSELTPSLSIYPCDDKTLKQCVTSISLNDLKQIGDVSYSIEQVALTPLPTLYHENCTLAAYRTYPGFYEYYALIVGDINVFEPVNIRLHAECLTGDLLGSLRCDCRAQLHKALEEFAEKTGVIIYIRQEGRNIGLLNKMRAYELQNQGHDTVDANHLLGFKLDERDYQAATLILKDLGISEVNVFTNNPDKLAALEKHDIKIANRVAHYTPTHKHNHNYVTTKRNKIGHLPE